MIENHRTDTNAVIEHERQTHMLCVGSRMAQSQRLPHCRVVGQLRLPSGAEKGKHVIACIREHQCHSLLIFVRACTLLA